MYVSDRTILYVCGHMEYIALENQFKVLASETRLRIVDVLLQNSPGLRFSEIAKALDIYPSTLEDHLKRLVNVGFISHKDGTYQCNVNTERVFILVKTLNDNNAHNYFSSHFLAVDDESLKERFSNPPRYFKPIQLGLDLFAKTLIIFWPQTLNL